MKPRPTPLLCVALASLAACGGERAPSPDANGNGQPKPAGAALPVDPDPPSPPAGTLLERAGGVKVEILEAGRGPVARAGRTLRLHHRTRVAQLHAQAASAPAAQAEPASAPAESAPAAAHEAETQEPSAHHEPEAPSALPAHDAVAQAGAAHAGAAEAASAQDPATRPAEPATAAEGAQAHPSGEAPASAPAELFSTFATGIPDEHVLGRGAWIAGLERALEGLRAGTRARATIPFALAYGEAGQGVVPPRADLEIELWIVDVR